MAIKAVLFDLDETLIDDAAAVDASFQETARLLLDRADRPLSTIVATAREVCDRLYERLPGLAVWDGIGMASWEVLSVFDTGRDAPLLAPLHRLAPDFRRRVWQDTLTALQIEDGDLAARLSARFLDARRRSHHLFADARPALEALAARLPLVLLTNGASSLQREKVDAVGIEPYFRAIVVSGEVGVGKPDPAVFRLALESIGVQPEEAVIVGDSIDRDVAGGAAAGVPTIWLNRSGNGQVALGYPLLTQISGLDEVLPLVDR